LIIECIPKFFGFKFPECREYGESIYQSTVLTIPGESAVIKKRNKCSHTVLPLIVGGEMAKEKEFPHMALIGE
jgi:hypothetical protein